MPIRVFVGIAILCACAMTAVALAAKPPAHGAKDSDHDGLSDRYERHHSHTRVHRRDTDRDGLGDGAEVKRYRTNPHRKDTDRDGLKDGVEVKRYKTNPRKRDSDGDGLSDRAEIKRYRTNPLKRDTDGDGLSDRDELKKFHTSPLAPDTDGDGVSDGKEVGSGGDPKAPPPEPPAPPQKRTVRACSQTVSSVAAVQSAVSGASTGAVICLADGSYGLLALDASKSGEVVVQPATSGGATIAGAKLDGSYLTLEGFRVEAGPTNTTTVDDVTIRGNKFVGPFGEDAIRLNRYHDTGDADSFGALVEGNEFTNVRENGNHSDCLQAVWVGDHLVYRRNYLHDNRCQGFFVKDQATAVDSIIATDNLFVRNEAPCDGDPDCGPPAPFQVWGPVGAFYASHNTVWEGLFTLRNSPWGSAIVTDSVLHKVYSDATAPFVNYSASGNIACDTDNRLDYPLTGITKNCSPPFKDAAHDDFRLPSGQGVSWRPADQQYGP
jgi:hypothetical protein